jgi:FkbM family methyltransferase
MFNLGTRIVREVQRWERLKRITPDWRRWAVRQRLARWILLPCQITTLQGSRFYLGHDPIDDRILEHVCASATDLYFPPGIAPPPGSLLLDIGAHHGIYAVEALRRYPHAHLLAVEPDPDACVMLARNLAANGMQVRAEIVQAGIGNVAGKAILEYSPEGSWGNCTRPLAPDADLPRGVGPIVPMLTLAEVLRARTPFLVKCSAQGAEFAAFAQMFALGLRPEWVILMAHPEIGSVPELLALFHQAGYTCLDADTPPKHARFHCHQKICTNAKV